MTTTRTIPARDITADMIINHRGIARTPFAVQLDLDNDGNEFVIVHMYAVAGQALSTVLDADEPVTVL